MGLLDDAIREHLELKRRRGADTGEVTRQEHEALGPARRTAEPLTPPGAEPPTTRKPPVPPEPGQLERDTGHLAREPAPEPFVDQDVWEDEPLPPEPEHPPMGASRPTVEFDAQDVEHLPPVPPERNRFEAPRPLIAPPEQARPPAAPPEPPPPPAVPHHDDALADHEPDVVPADEEPEGEDLLEETPEFLEETPEHDRLWFEQRPPRDFDFGN